MAPGLSSNRYEGIQFRLHNLNVNDLCFGTRSEKRPLEGVWCETLDSRKGGLGLGKGYLYVFRRANSLEDRKLVAWSLVEPHSEAFSP